MVCTLEICDRIHVLEELKCRIISWSWIHETRYYRAENKYSYFAGYKTVREEGVKLLDAELVKLLLEWVNYHLEQARNNLHVPPSERRVKDILWMLYRVAKPAEKIVLNKEHNWNSGAPSWEREYEEAVYIIPPGTVPLVHVYYYNNVRRTVEYSNIDILGPSRTVTENPVNKILQQLPPELPEDVKQRIIELKGEGYAIVVTKETELVFDACDTDTTVERCKSSVSVIYGNAEVKDDISYSEFPAGTWTGSGKHIVHVKTKPTVLAYKLRSDNFGQTKQVVVVI